MKKRMRVNVSVFLFLVLIGLCSGCTQSEVIEIHNPSDVIPAEYEEGVIDIAPEMVPLTESPAMFTIPVPTASGTEVKKTAKAEIDYSNSKDGYVMVKYLTSTTKELRVIIKGPSGASYTYTLKSSGNYEVFPFSDGNGSYSVNVYEQTEGSKYATINAVTISVTLNDEFAPFIRPNQYVNYNKDSQTVIKAAELVDGESALLDQIAVVYNYVINNITYDKDLAAKIVNGEIKGYLPDVDAVLKKGKGICFDYAAVMATMLRSQGIPCKLVVGYTGEIYHAWINAYSKETGWIDNVIYFEGTSWKLMDPTFASSGNQSKEVMKYIGDGSNYTAKYLY